MKKKVWIFCIIAVCIGCAGCGKKEDKSEDTLTVCVESYMAEEVRDVLDLWEALHEGGKGEVEVIPADSDAAQIKISNIQTAMMSGKGPDVFLLSAEEPLNEEGEFPCLFTNPEKIMYTDTFLALDAFMEQAEYADPENWNQKILDAGKTEEGQMILPLTYNYNQYAFQKADLQGEKDIPSSWEELRKCEDPVIQGGMFFQAYSFFPLFGKLADYKEGKLLFSEEELQKWTQEAAEYIAVNEKKETSTETAVLQNIHADSSFYDSLASSQEEMVISGFPNINGGVTAAIDLYAAVNRGTKMKEEAFSFLDLLFCDEVLFGPGIKAGEKWMGNLFCHKLESRRLIHSQYLSKRYPKLSQEDLMVLEEADKRVNAVCFYSDLERELYEMFRLYVVDYFRGEDEVGRKELVSKTYGIMEMKVLE